MTATPQVALTATRREGAPLLQVRDLQVRFTRRGRQPVRAVDGVSFDVAPGQVVGLVGESGCGKSVTSLAIMGLLPKRAVEVEGEVLFEGSDLLTLPDSQLRDLRGRDVAMVFQDPMTSLNPVVPVGRRSPRCCAGTPGWTARPPAPRPRTCCAGRHPRPGPPAQGVPAPAVRRHAPARADRHRAGLQAAAAHRRRADHRARRDDPGAGARAAQAAGPRDRHRDDHDHARPGVVAGSATRST
jgi:ABC-type oligopeptide transport system ATPase subunit